MSKINYKTVTKVVNMRFLVIFFEASKAEEAALTKDFAAGQKKPTLYISEKYAKRVLSVGFMVEGIILF